MNYPCKWYSTVPGAEWAAIFIVVIKFYKLCFVSSVYVFNLQNSHTQCSFYVRGLVVHYLH